MPEISRFLGIVIQMYFADHDSPHFHVRSASARARIRITPVELLNGTLPPRLLKLVLEWARLHQAELLENWNRLQTGQLPFRIAPME